MLTSTQRSALSISLAHAGIVESWHYGSAGNDYLIRPGKGLMFRQAVHAAGLSISMEYRQDGDPSGLSDWRRIA